MVAIERHIPGAQRISGRLLIFRLEQTQFLRAFAEDATELLDIVRAGEGGTSFPTGDVEGERCADTISNILLGPAALLACGTQQVIGPGLGSFLHHASLQLYGCLRFLIILSSGDDR